MATIGQEIAMLAESQVGTTNGSRYADGRSEAWCGDFAQWVLNKVGLGNEANPSVPEIVQNAKNNGNWHANGSGYTPQVGDLVTFDWGHDGNPDHVGVVTGVNQNGSVRVVSGNSTGYGKTGGESCSSGAVTQQDYNMNSGDILGYVHTPGSGGANVPGSSNGAGGNPSSAGNGQGDVAGLSPLSAGSGSSPSIGGGSGAGSEVGQLITLLEALLQILQSGLGGIA